MSQEVILRLADEPAAAAQARALARHLGGQPHARIEDVRLLLSELVAAALYEGLESVDVRITVYRDCLRLEVTPSPGRKPRRFGTRLTPAAELGRRVIEDLSDRSGDDGDSAWCELDGAWTLARNGFEASLHTAPSAGGPLIPAVVKG